MQDVFTGILQFFSPNNWSLEGIPLIAAALLLFFSVRFFAPKLRYWFLLLSKKRRYWAYQAMVGMRMSKRAKDILVGKAVYEALLQLIDKRVLTHREKRRYLKIIETAFDIEPGVIRPIETPHVKEVKRRIFGRLSAKSANVVALSPRRRLAAIVSSKG